MVSFWQQESKTGALSFSFLPAVGEQNQSLVFRKSFGSLLKSGRSVKRRAYA